MNTGIFNSDAMALEAMQYGIGEDTYDIIVSLESKSAAMRTKKGFRQVTVKGPFPTFEPGERIPANMSKNGALSYIADRYGIEVMSAFIRDDVAATKPSTLTDIAAAFPDRFRFLIENAYSENGVRSGIAPLIAGNMTPEEIAAFKQAGKHVDVLFYMEAEIEEAA